MMGALYKPHHKENSLMTSRYALPATKKEYKLSPEAAEAQLLDMLCYYDIDIARVANEAEQTALERAFDQLRDYIREGKVEIRRGTGEKLEVVHNTVSGSQLVYGEVGAAAKLAMDKHPGDQHYARTYAMLGSLSGVGSAGIQKLGPKDLAVAEILGTLFRAA